MKRSIERARQKAALEVVETYDARITALENQVKQLKTAVGKLMKALKGGPDG